MIIPTGAEYAVAPRAHDIIAWCGNLASALVAMKQIAKDFECDIVIDVVVTRIEDNARIWPWTTSGGNA